MSRGQPTHCVRNAFDIGCVVGDLLAHNARLTFMWRWTLRVLRLAAHAVNNLHLQRCDVGGNAPKHLIVAGRLRVKVSSVFPFSAPQG